MLLLGMLLVKYLQFLVLSMYVKSGPNYFRHKSDMAALEAKFIGSLNGYVALVTGASRGIGKGIAQMICEAGATVYITGMENYV